MDEQKETGERVKSKEVVESAEDETEYYKQLRSTEYKKSDASLFPSYSNLTVP